MQGKVLEEGGVSLILGGMGSFPDNSKVCPVATADIKMRFTKQAQEQEQKQKSHSNRRKAHSDHIVTQRTTHRYRRRDVWR